MKKLALIAGSALTMGYANAAIDTAAITAAGGDVALVGGAVFAVIVGVKVFKWIRAAL